jgi:alpha-amylase
MVDTCKNAGVGVLVDVVLNHMTAGSGTGVAGTGFTQYTYTGLYSGFDFHYCGSKNRGISKLLSTILHTVINPT